MLMLLWYGCRSGWGLVTYQVPELLAALTDVVVVEWLWGLDARVAVVEMEVSGQYLELRMKVSGVEKV